MLRGGWRQIWSGVVELIDRVRGKGLVQLA